MTILHNSDKKFVGGSTENLKSRFADARKSYLTGCSFTKFAFELANSEPAGFTAWPQTLGRIAKKN